ncbi:MAG: flagellar export protein FliJ [Rhodothermaceae bacterium]|nr:flagellar export protein FliJ [Rhodothermaceae bacterium]
METLAVMAGKKFRFSLDHLLRLRRHQAEQAEQALAGAIRTRHDHEARLEAAEDMVQTLAAEAPTPGTGTPADFRRFAATQQEAFRARTQARAALEVAQREESDARRALVKARQPEEALHTLQTREQAAHHQGQQRAETAILDDQANAAYCRQLRSEA